MQLQHLDAFENILKDREDEIKFKTQEIDLWRQKLQDFEKEKNQALEELKKS